MHAPRGVECVTAAAAATPTPEEDARKAHAALARGASALTAAQQAGDKGRAAAFLHESLDAFREARAVNPDEIGADLGMGRVLYLLGRFDQARLGFERARRKDDVNPDAHWWLALTFLAMERQAEAVPALTRVTELEPGFGAGWHRLTEALVAQDELADAVRAFERATVAQPRDAELQLKYGETLESKLGQRVPALERYRRAIVVAEDTGDHLSRARARLRAGGALLQLEQRAEALSQFEIILEQDLKGIGELGVPADARREFAGAAHYGAGISSLGLKRYRAGLAHLVEARQLSPSLALFAFNLEIAVLWSLGRYASAWRLTPALAEVVQRAREAGVADDDADFARSYGTLLRLLGRRDEAIDLYRGAIATSPQDTWLRAAHRHAYGATRCRIRDAHAEGSRAERLPRA